MNPLKIEFTPQAEAVLAKLKQIPQRALRGIVRGMDQANLRTVDIIRRDFLNFPKQGPTSPIGLRIQSRRYRDSLRASKSVIVGDTVQSSIGTNVVSKGGVSYPRVHEFGFKGTVQVPAHTRKPGRSFLIGGKVIAQRAAGEFLTKAGKPRKKSGLVEIHETRAVLIDVAAHPMKINLPARAPIQRGIQKNLEYIKRTVSKNVVQELSNL